MNACIQWVAAVELTIEKTPDRRLHCNRLFNGFCIMYVLAFVLLFIVILVASHACSAVLDFLADKDRRRRLEHCHRKASEWSIETQNDRTKWMDDYDD